MPRQQNYFFTVLFLSFFSLFFSTRISLALFHVLVFLYEQPVPCSFLYLPFSRYSVAVFFVRKPSISFGGAATQLALSCHDVCCCCITLLSIMIFALTLRSKRSRAKKKCGPNYERSLFDFVFLETNRLGAKAPTPTPTRTFTFRGQLVSCCCCCFCLFVFFLCQKLKTWSLFALYSLEMLSTLTFISWLLVFEGCPSKPLYQSWLTTPFAKMTEVVSTIIL